MRVPHVIPAELNMLDAALRYARRGWYVILLHGITPFGCTCGGAGCERPGKHPRLRSAHTGATADEGTIRAWFRKFPNSNIGVHLGLSGLIALDADHQKVVQLLTEEMDTPTWRQRTGRGAHYLFSYPEETGRKRTRLDGGPWDLLMGNSYVVMSPSRHVSGVRYVADDPDAAIAECPPWIRKALTEGPQPAKPKRMDRPLAHATRRPRARYVQAMLDYEANLETDDRVRHADPKTYKPRHPQIWSVLLHELQRGQSEEEVVATILTSTLRTKAQEHGDPRRWLINEVEKARQHISDYPAGFVSSALSIEAANRDDSGLSSTRRKVLRAFQERAADRVEGRFSLSVREAAIAASTSVSTVHKAVRWLQNAGWLSQRWKATRGKSLATVYSLTIPARCRSFPDEAANVEGGQGANTTPRIGCGVVGGVRSVTPPPTDVSVDNDAFRWGRELLGGSVRILQALSVSTPQSGKALARRLEREPSSIRYHLKKLRSLGLLVEVADGVCLDPQWEESLPGIAERAGVLGRADRDRQALVELRRHRWEHRRAWARRNNIPLRSAASLPLPAPPATPGPFPTAAPSPIPVFRRGCPTPAELQEFPEEDAGMPDEHYQLDPTYA